MEVQMEHTSVAVAGVTIVVFVLGIFSLLKHFLKVKYDPREPPLIPSTLPYFGHLIGLVRKGPRYFENLRLAGHRSCHVAY